MQTRTCNLCGGLGELVDEEGRYPCRGCVCAECGESPRELMDGLCAECEALALAKEQERPSEPVERTIERSAAQWGW